VHIGLVIYGSLETVTGGYIYDRMLVEHLRHQGDLVDIISLPWRDYGRHLIDNVSWSVYRRLRSARLDILLEDELNHPSLLGLNHWLRSRVRYPILAIVHHLRCSEARPVWQNAIYRWLERHYLSSVDGFIFNSQTTKASVEAVLGKPKPAVVAHPGGDRIQLDLTDNQISSRARGLGPLRILFVGSLIPRKGLHTLLDGLSRIPRYAWQLEIVGSLEVDRAYARAVRRQVLEMGLTDRVAFSGPLSDSELTLRLRQSQLFCVPSSYEGFGIVYLEAMGAGLTAIASTAGAADEIITHGRDGFLVPPDDAVALAQCVDTLSRDREQLARMSLAARERFRLHPTWTVSTDRIRQFLKTWTN
jgi:glycosyltransferase involved in cell wall biosynthesis